MVKALILTTCNLMLTVINNQGYSHRGWKLNLIKAQLMFIYAMLSRHGTFRVDFAVNFQWNSFISI